MHSVGRCSRIGRVTFESIPKAMRSTPRYEQAVILSREVSSIPDCSRISQPYDVVFCRNLLIYLIPSAREALLALVNRVLAADGVLLIGHADRLEATEAGRRFAPTGDPGCFAYRRITHSKPPGVCRLRSA